MLASALRSLVVAEFRGNKEESLYSVLLDSPLDGAGSGARAAALAWDTLGQRLVLAVTGAQRGDRLSFIRWDGREERVALPPGTGVNDLSVSCRLEEGSAWAVAACSDGALRFVDAASTGGAPKVSRTVQGHGVASTAVQLSPSMSCVASGSSSGRVVVQPFAGMEHMEPTPLPDLAKDRDPCPITSLRFSPLKRETLAGCDAGGCIQVWDVAAFRHACRFATAHRGAARSISFSNHNDALLISTGDDSQLIFWDVNQGCQIREVAVETALASLSYHVDGFLLAAGTCSGSVLLFDLRMLTSKTSPAMPVARIPSREERPGTLRALEFAPGEVVVPLATAAAPPRRPVLAAPPGASDVAGCAGDAEEEALNHPPTAASIQNMLNRLSSRGGAAGAGFSAPAAGALNATCSQPTPTLVAGVVSAGTAAGAAAAVPPSVGLGTAACPRQLAVSSAAGQRQDADRPEAAAVPLQNMLVTDSLAEPSHSVPAAGPSASCGSREATGGHAAELRSLMNELRQELRREVQDTQFLLLEQNFRLHAELRRDVEALRAEV